MEAKIEPGHEFRGMSDEDLEAEWLGIEQADHDGHGFFTLRALYILRERVRRLEAHAAKALEQG